mmetsp:Transcript_28246/g.63941  ORF Transcript_28246/g.63941 Transcript_28246/m.63941 type:complete len:210 (-) Transcript_28246:62-691(-)
MRGSTRVSPGAFSSSWPRRLGLLERSWIACGTFLITRKSIAARQSRVVFRSPPTLDTYSCTGSPPAGRAPAATAPAATGPLSDCSHACRQPAGICSDGKGESSKSSPCPTLIAFLPIRKLEMAPMPLGPSGRAAAPLATPCGSAATASYCRLSPCARSGLLSSERLAERRTPSGSTPSGSTPSGSSGGDSSGTRFSALVKSPCSGRQLK